MLIFLSDGRLGNQLFQYSFLNTIVKEDEKILAVNMEQFIGKFDINNTKFKHFALGKYGKYFIRKFVKPLVMVCVWFKLIGFISQDRNAATALSTFTTKKGLLPISLVETNFFQSEKFFYKDKVDFKIKDKYMKEAASFLTKVPNEYTKIFIHIRRGDYLFESYLGKTGIDLPKSYFEDAMRKISHNIEKPFFVFLSDDASFVEYWFENINNKIVSKNSMAVDFAIMNLCEYGIVANSSFSWWGAYMMKNKIKVIFPKYWYGWKVKIESHPGIQPSWGSVIEVDRILK
jgi:hypothetical protein